MHAINKRHRGFLLTDLIVGLTILGLLLVGLAVSLNGFVRLNHYQMTKQRCISAAQAQLDSISVAGKQIPDDDFKRLWPKLTVFIKASPGAGQWEGLKLVEVTTTSQSSNKQVKVQLHRYILADGKGLKGHSPILAKREQ